MADVPAGAGAIDTFVTHPESGGPFPAVVIYMDVWGLREELFDVARRIAAVGYYCLVPNLYRRQGKIRNAYYDDRGRMITLDLLDPDRRDRVRAPLDRLSDAMVVEDTASILKFVDADPAACRGGPLGCLGYCMGGRHVFRASAAFPKRVRAAASLHGTDLVTDAVDSPHLSAALMQGEVYCGFGEKDRHTPCTTLDTLAHAFARTDARYTFAVHQGADHGYALPDRDVFDKQAANRDWEVIFAMFRRQLHSGPASQSERTPAQDMKGGVQWRR